MNFRYIITLSYKGKNYHGWQMQPNVVTVQQKIIDALEILLRHKVCLHGAGRTDTGVHASFFVAHFDAEKKILNPQKIIKSLNGILNKDISIYHIFQVSKDFHSRFYAISRTYKYLIFKKKNPFFNDLGLIFTYGLNVNLMNEATAIVKNYNDFKSFEKAHSNSKTSFCEIYEAFWVETENTISFTIKANRFLRNMVRSIVGTLLDVGKEKISLNDFDQIIKAKDRSKAGVSADAKGLFLTDIQYPEPVNQFLDISRKMSKTNFNIF